MNECLSGLEWSFKEKLIESYDMKQITLPIYLLKTFEIVRKLQNH